MQFEPLAEADHIKLDQFPAKVFTTDEEPILLHKDCRVIVTDAHYYIFKEGGQGPEVVEAGPMTAYAGSIHTGWSIEAPETQNFTVQRDINCGCGSRLKGFHPFPGVGYAPVVYKEA